MRVSSNKANTFDWGDEMDVTIKKNSNAKQTIVFVAGEIDIFTVPKLKSELLPLAKTENHSLIVSLKEVSYMDSTGLGAFAGLFKLTKQNSSHLKLVELPKRIERVFQITGLSNIIDISPKIEGGVQ